MPDRSQVAEGSGYLSSRSRTPEAMLPIPTMSEALENVSTSRSNKPHTIRVAASTSFHSLEIFTTCLSSGLCEITEDSTHHRRQLQVAAQTRHSARVDSHLLIRVRATRRAGNRGSADADYGLVDVIPGSAPRVGPTKVSAQPVGDLRRRRDGRLLLSGLPTLGGFRGHRRTP